LDDDRVGAGLCVGKKLICPVCSETSSFGEWRVWKIP
jgi:hypothetical protein